MPRLTASLLALVLGAIAAPALAGCGEEDAQLLPGETAREITTNLDAVKQLAGEGDCAGAQSAAQQVGEQVEALQGVDRRLKQALEDGAARLSEVIAGCEQAATEAIAPATIPPATEEEDEAPDKEKDEKDEDKGEGEEKEKEKEAKDEADVAEPPASPPPLPPQAEGEAKGRAPSETEAPAETEEGAVEAPPGGVSPGSPAGEGD